MVVVTQGNEAEQGTVQPSGQKIQPWPASSRASASWYSVSMGIQQILQTIQKGITPLGIDPMPRPLDRAEDRLSLIHI